MPFIALFKSDNNLYIAAGSQPPNAIIAFETIEKGLDYFEDGYNRFHNRGYESSMSACVNFIQFTPSIVEFKDLEEIKNNIAAEEPRLVVVSSISGRMTGITTKKEAISYYEKGAVPSLISKKTFS